MIETNLYRDHFQNFKRYNIPKAQLIISDIPYNLGNNATELNRKAFGFEIDRKIYSATNKWVLKMKQRKHDIDTYGFSKTELESLSPSLFT